MINKKNPFSAKSENDIVRNNISCRIDFKNEKKISEEGMIFLKLILNENPLLRPSINEALNN